MLFFFFSVTFQEPLALHILWFSARYTDTIQ